MAKKLTKDRHWTIKEITYLEQNYAHKTAKQIAEDLGRSVASIRRKIKNLNIRKPKRKKKTNCYKPHADSTLCWDCDNAYAHKCLWIQRGIEVWDKAKKRKCIWDGYKEVELVQVIECKHFVLDKKLRGGKAVEGRI